VKSLGALVARAKANVADRSGNAKSSSIHSVNTYQLLLYIAHCWHFGSKTDMVPIILKPRAKHYYLEKIPSTLIANTWDSAGGHSGYS
jgi:hypothetical protein